jgi:hypothetical protein
MSLPGFSAETALYRTNTRYGSTGIHGLLPGAGGVVPQRENGAPRCGECSDLLLGTRWCCEGEPLSICSPEPCGLVVDIVRILRGIFR